VKSTVRFVLQDIERGDNMTEQEKVSSVPPEQQAAMEFEAHRRTYSAGAGWFYLIAGLSVVNTVIALFRGGFGFIFGLGVTQVVDAIAAMVLQQQGDAAGLVRLIALGVSVFFSGIFAMFGLLANRGKGWALIVGMVLYLLDGLVLLLVQDWLGVAFHGYALFYMFRGYQALSHLRRITAAPPGAAAGTAGERAMTEAEVQRVQRRNHERRS
jgi:hypothetical protein